MCKHEVNKILIDKNNIINTIFSNHINIWKFHYKILPKIQYFDSILLINIYRFVL